MFRSELVLAIHTAQLIRLVIRKVVYDSSSNIFYGGTKGGGNMQRQAGERNSQVLSSKFQTLFLEKL